MSERYFAKLPTRPPAITQEMRDLLRRRTLPFLEGGGTDKPLSHLLQEAYLQGIRDAMQVAQKEASEV